MSAAKKQDESGAEDFSIKTLMEAQKRPVTSTEMNMNIHLKDLLRESTEAAQNSEKGPSGRSLTYGHTVLSNVVFARYQDALDGLDRIMELQEDYPEFGYSATRYVQHAKSLVRALKAKRAIGKLPHVSRAKQKELVHTLTLHFEDLRACIVNIEKLERQIRKKDLSSTRYFVAALYWAVFAVFIGAALQFALPLYAYSIHAYITEMLSNGVIFIVNLIWPF